MPAIVGEHLTKVFGRGETEVVALDDVSIGVDGGELVARTEWIGQDHPAARPLAHRPAGVRPSHDGRSYDL